MKTETILPSSEFHRESAGPKTYGVGTHLFCDFHFSGKPKAVCVAVITPGTGKDNKGRVRVKIKENLGAYRKGEEIEISTFEAVPTKQEFRKPGSVFRWVDTNYAWQNS
jgi:hypothetical protein